MPYRRRRTSFRRRRFSGVRQISEPRRWEAANFFFDEEFTAGASVADVVAFDLMNVNHFDGFGADPRQLADAMRTIEIGGMVWDTAVTNVRPGQTTATAQLSVHEVLATDRIDGVGTPISLAGMDWSLVSSPVSGSATGATDGSFPVRIHKRRFAAAAVPLAAAAPIQAALNPIFSNTWGTQKVRLRGGLGDRQGLFLFIQFTNWIATAGTAAVNIKVAGTLYYRAKF